MAYEFREVASGLRCFLALLPQILNVYKRAGRAYLILSTLLTIYDGIAVSISIYFTKLLVDEAHFGLLGRRADGLHDVMGGQIAVWTTDVLCRPMRTILGTRATYVAQHDLEIVGFASMRTVRSIEAGLNTVDFSLPSDRYHLRSRLGRGPSLAL